MVLNGARIPAVEIREANYSTTTHYIIKNVVFFNIYFNRVCNCAFLLKNVQLINDIEKNKDNTSFLNDQNSSTRSTFNISSA